MAKYVAFKYVVIGNSAGGIGAIEAIRDLDPTGSIALVSDEATVAYSRPGIAEVVAGAKTPERITYRDAEFYEVRRIATHFGRTATAIDTATKTVTLDDGSALGYERLLIAAGGTPIRPPMGGADKSGVLSFTTVADAVALKKRIERVGKRVVVIGGGLIGASCSDALARAGARPTVIELRDRVLNLLLDEPGSELARRAMAKAGVELICGATVNEVLGRTDEPDSVGGALLADGRTIDCDAVVVAVGVRPRLQIAADAGIQTNRGIVVDRRMATSAPDVYAVGDVAEAFDCIFEGNRVVPIWPSAYLGGRVAGRNMAGDRATFDSATVMNSLKYFGLSLVSAGEINIDLTKGESQGYEVLRKLDLEADGGKGTYRKIVLKDNRLVGFVFAGRIERSGVVNGLLKDRVDVSAFKDRLLREDFDLIDLPAALRWARYNGSTARTAAPARPLWARSEGAAAAWHQKGGANGSH